MEVSSPLGRSGKSGGAGASTSDGSRNARGEESSSPCVSPEFVLPSVAVGSPPSVVVVSGPKPKTLLVMDFKKPCSEVTVVQVDAGCVIVIGTVVVTMEAMVVWTGEVRV